MSNKTTKEQRLKQILNENNGNLILEDLIDINNSKDTSLFVRHDNQKVFDIVTKFGKISANEIYTKESFEVVITEDDLLQQIDQVEKTTSHEEFLKNPIIKSLNIKYKDLLIDNFNNAKKAIIEELSLQMQKSNKTWKEFVSQADDKLVETNTWTIYIGFMFISFLINETSNTKQFFAPLFLKEATVTVENGRAVLKADGPIKKNEKIFLILKSSGFDLEINEDFTKASIKNVFEKTKKLWSARYAHVMPEDILEKTPRRSYEDIKNKTIKFHPGMLLGLFEPMGGYIRDRMNEIIKNNKIDGIIDVTINKKKYTKRIDSVIFNNSNDEEEQGGLIKVTPTNYSQDRATISALNQHTIIWGPPGTGKSQTIGNILANILYYEKTALVVSEKRAALDVLRKRLGRLSKFALFLLTNKNVDIFYDPIIKYIDNIETADEAEDVNAVSVFSADEKNYYQIMKKASFSSQSDLIFDIIESVMKNNANFTKSTFKNLQDLVPYKLKFPNDIIFDNNFIKNVLKFNKLNSLNSHSWSKAAREKKAKIIPLLKNISELAEKYDNLNFLIDLIAQVEDTDILNQVIALSRSRYKIDQAKPISTDYEIEKILTSKILDKIEELPNNLKEKYKEFTTSAKLKNLNPFHFLKKYIDIIKILFPIIITTPDVDLSNWKEQEFDYCIVDECSQVKTQNGLPALYLAKIKILSGDQQQMRPSTWFKSKNTNNAYWGNNDSLLDFAITKGVCKIHLEKNYRSNKSLLMGFSNKIFYESKLNIIDSNMNHHEQAIEVVNIDDVVNETNYNLKEVEIVVQKAKENLKKYSTIILLAFNAPQADKIRDYIFSNEPELGDAVINNKIMIKNIENIQGEEANLVIISVVYNEQSRISSTYVGIKNGDHSLNVAITRAIDKMIVVKSIKANHIKITHETSKEVTTFRNWLRFLDMNDEERYEFLKAENNEIPEPNIDRIFDLKEKMKTKIIDSIHQSIPRLPKGMRIEIDYRIGLQKVDLAILKESKLIIGFNIDYSQLKDKEEFITLRDNNLFLRVKGYNIFLIDQVVWANKRNEFIEQIIQG
ncbi:AAA domain-containing protein [Mycoplasma sp. M5725]|uniref:AAA domain-containing protein n=1 Tax=Mycoplasma phocimorsus TaxID=3045839 RepID=A0AAJ1PSR7_9MOLU|nr:AAA domain-containing protein [Mycoplasma phocimorsus]MDJ1645834.1 AAA domain-containing protein [Mycoplasma phocimorsus]